jgi:hippurate hydrolase
MMASSDSYTLTVRGQGGHGAEPDHTRDPIVAGAAIVSALQTIVSRNTAPQAAAVVSAVAFLAGSPESSNVIPDQATIKLSVRSLDPATRDMLLTRIPEVAQLVGQGYGVKVDVDHSEISPVVMNTAEGIRMAATAADQVLGAENVDTNSQPFMNSEDFAFMMDKRPGAYVLFDNGDRPTAHQSTFDFNDEIITEGAAYFARLVQNYLVADSADATAKAA